MKNLLFILSIIISGVVVADERKYGSFILDTEIPDTLFFTDEIKPNDSFELRKALRNHDIQNIVLASPGGNVWEGLQMAGIIFDKRLRTYIPQDSVCASACSYLFFAGNERLADGKLGVHQAYSSDTKKQQAIGQTQYATQFTVSEIIGFLNEFGTPAFVYERMFQDIDMYFFNATELSDLNSVNFSENYDTRSSFNRKVLELKRKGSTRTAYEQENAIEPEMTEKEFIGLLQKKLKEVGCDPGPADGIWGRKTQSAAVTFAKTAGLPTNNDVLITEEFVQKLAEAPKNFCPKPKIKKRPSGKFSGTWATSANCSHLGIGNVSGKAQLTYKSTAREAVLYSVRYTNNLGQNATGTLTHFTSDNTVRIFLSFGGNIGTVTADLRESNGVYSGNDSNRCPLIVYKN